MRLLNFAAATAAILALSSNASAAVRPAVANGLSIAPMQAAGERLGSATSSKRSNLAGGGAGMVIVAVAAVGIGAAVADAAGAFHDDDHRLSVSP